MKNNFKKVIVCFLIMIIVFPSLSAGYATSTAEDAVYPDAVHSTADELVNGKWKYRELFVHTTCDDITQIPAANDYADMKVASDDTRTYFEKAAARYKKIGVEVEELHPNVDYAFSGYVTSDVDCGACMLGGVYVVFDADGTRLSSGANDMSVTSFASKPEWQKIKKTLRFTQYKDKTDGKIYDIPEGGFIANEAEWRKEIFITHGLADTTVTFGIDDVSFRQIPSWSVYATGAEYVAQDGKNMIRYTFDKDIDKWSCEKDLFTANNCTVDSVAVTTDELTRKTSLDVAYTITGDNAAITLPKGLIDAWGREIVDVEDYATIPVSNGIDKASGRFYYDVTDVTSEDYTVFVAAFDGNRLINVTAAVVSDGKATGEMDVNGIDKVVFYVWETITIQPLKEQYEYFITQ